MPEITTRLGPLRLTWDIEYTTDGVNVIEVFTNLIGISDEAMWRASQPFPQWTKDRHDHHVWKILWEMIEDDARFKPSADKCREAIERERLDLRREDAERFSRP